MSSTSVDAVGGSVTISGTGGEGKNSNLGVRATKTAVISRNSTIVISGTARTATTGSGNVGIDFSRGTIEAGSDVDISGSGGGGRNGNVGVKITSTTVTGGGTVTVDASTQSTTTGSSNHGALMGKVDITGSEISFNAMGEAAKRTTKDGSGWEAALFPPPGSWRSVRRQ
jgi:hypothetical protein